MPGHPRRPRDDADRRLLALLERHGWYVIKVMECEGGPAFAYSVGLFHTFGHPEILLLGLDMDLMHGLINIIGEDVRAGAAYRPGRLVEDVLEGYSVDFREVARSHYREYLGYARWFHGGDNFPALQCVWPDMQGRFPDDPDAPESFRRDQPLLDA